MIISRKPFTELEDNLILKGVQLYGKDNWKLISELVTNRTGHQVRERYRNYLNPNLNKQPWTPEEDAMLKMLFTQHGSKWSTFSKAFQGRTPTAIKNRWNVYLSKNIEHSSKTEIHEDFIFDFPEPDFEESMFYL
jgi:myb proto-oncogene protein